MVLNRLWLDYQGCGSFIRLGRDVLDDRRHIPLFERPNEEKMIHSNPPMSKIVG